MDQGRTSTLRVVRRSAGYLWPVRGTAAAVLAGLFAGIVLAVAAPSVTRLLTDEGILRRDLRRISLFSLLYLALEVTRSAVDYLQGNSLRRLGGMVARALRQEVFAHLQRVPPSYYEARPVGQIVAGVTADAAAVGETLSAALVGILRGFIVTVGVVAVLLLLNPRFGLLTIMISVIVGMPAVVFRRSAQEYAGRSMEALSRLHDVLEEHISGHRVIRLFGLGRCRNESFERENKYLVQAALSSLRGQTHRDGWAAVVSSLALTLTIGIGGAAAGSGALSLGTLVAFVQYVPYLLGAVGELAHSGVAVLSGIAAGRRLFDTLETPAGLSFPTSALPSPEVEGRVVISEVRFGYRDGHEVLKGISEVIRARERVVLVGRTGAGKTTLARLIARLHDPWQGNIFLDGRDLRSLTSSELRRRIAFGTQSVFMFSGTILENVRLGDERIGYADVVEACKEVGAHRFIARMPRGYDFVLAEGGRGLSVGERQLLSLARILVRRPAVAVLDEPTANVDPATERIVLEAFNRVLRRRTAIVIAHRLATLRDADRVLVLEAGTIVESAPPDVLLSPGGRLHSLIDRKTHE